MKETDIIKSDKFYIIFVDIENSNCDPDTLNLLFGVHPNVFYLIGTGEKLEFDDKESWELYYQLNK